MLLSLQAEASGCYCTSSCMAPGSAKPAVRPASTSSTICELTPVPAKQSASNARGSKAVKPRQLAPDGPCIRTRASRPQPAPTLCARRLAPQQLMPTQLGPRRAAFGLDPLALQLSGFWHGRTSPGGSPTARRPWHSRTSSRPSRCRVLAPRARARLPLRFRFFFVSFAWLQGTRPCRVLRR